MDDKDDEQPQVPVTTTVEVETEETKEEEVKEEKVQDPVETTEVIEVEVEVETEVEEPKIEIKNDEAPVKTYAAVPPPSPPPAKAKAPPPTDDQTPPKLEPPGSDEKPKKSKPRSGSVQSDKGKKKKDKKRTGSVQAPAGATEIKLKPPADTKPLTKYQMRRLETHIPDNMALYETDWRVQLFLFGVTVLIAVLNLSYNFEMLAIYEAQAADLRFAINNPNVTALESGALLTEYFNRTGEGEQLCDIDFFNSTASSGSELLETADLLVRISKASTYLAMIVFVPLHLGLKCMNASYMVSHGYGDKEERKAQRKASKKEAKEARKASKQGSRQASVQDPRKGSVQDPRKGSVQDPRKGSVQSRQGATQALTVTQQAAQKSMAPEPQEVVRVEVTKKMINNQRMKSVVLESADEAHVRKFLRGETLLFGWIQGFQDIPQATLAVLFIIFERAVRGVRCYEAYLRGEVNPPADFESINSTAFFMIGLVVASTVWNFTILGARWIQYFHHRRSRRGKQRRTTLYRVVIALVILVIYFVAIATPVSALIYTRVGTDVIGIPEEAIEPFFYLTVVGAAFAGSAFLLICCYWGTNWGEGAWATCVVCEVCLVGVGICDVSCTACNYCCSRTTV